MRISDWSSDVCSSDLHDRHGHNAARPDRGGADRKPQRGAPDDPFVRQPTTQRPVRQRADDRTDPEGAQQPTVDKWTTGNQTARDTWQDPNTGLYGKSVSGREDFGGPRPDQKKN